MNNKSVRMEKKEQARKPRLVRQLVPRSKIISDAYNKQFTQ